MGHLEDVKFLCLAGDPDITERLVIASYFSHPAYLNLYHSLRHFCRTSDKERKISSRSIDGEKDFFPLLDAMYDEVLSLFDVAIGEVFKENDSQVSTIPVSTSVTKPSANQTDEVSSPPPSITHVPTPVLNSMSTRASASTGSQTIRRIQPERAKRLREEGPSDSGNNKRAKVAPLPSKSRIPNTTPTVRRSERLRAIREAMPAPPPAAPGQRKSKTSTVEAGVKSGRTAKKK